MQRNTMMISSSKQLIAVLVLLNGGMVSARDSKPSAAPTCTVSLSNCILENISDGTETPLNQTDSYVADGEDEFSVYCETRGGKVDKMKFYYENIVHTERKERYYMGGDWKGWINRVAYLKECGGEKKIKIVGEKGRDVCFEYELSLKAVCAETPTPAPTESPTAEPMETVPNSNPPTIASRQANSIAPSPRPSLRPTPAEVSSYPGSLVPSIFPSNPRPEALDSFWIQMYISAPDLTGRLSESQQLRLLSSASYHLWSIIEASLDQNENPCGVGILDLSFLRVDRQSFSMSGQAKWGSESDDYYHLSVTFAASTFWWEKFEGCTGTHFAFEVERAVNSFGDDPKLLDIVSRIPGLESVTNVTWGPVSEMNYESTLPTIPPSPSPSLQPTSARVSSYPSTTGLGSFYPTFSFASSGAPSPSMFPSNPRSESAESFWVQLYISAPGLTTKLSDSQQNDLSTAVSWYLYSSVSARLGESGNSCGIGIMDLSFPRIDRQIFSASGRAKWGFGEYELYHSEFYHLSITFVANSFWYEATEGCTESLASEVEKTIDNLADDPNLLKLVAQIPGLESSTRVAWGPVSVFYDGSTLPSIAPSQLAATTLPSSLIPSSVPGSLIPSSIPEKSHVDYFMTYGIPVRFMVPSSFVDLDETAQHQLVSLTEHHVADLCYSYDHGPGVGVSDVSFWPTVRSMTLDSSHRLVIEFEANIFWYSSLEDSSLLQLDGAIRSGNDVELLTLIVSAVPSLAGSKDLIWLPTFETD